MKIQSRIFVWIALFLVASLPCAAATNLWDGTWKLDTSRSVIPDPDFRVTVTPSGEFQIETGTSRYSFKCDGKDYPSVGQGAIACLHLDARSMDTVWKEHGKITSTIHRELSPDGKTLTSTGTVVHTDGSQEARGREYSRVSLSTGFAGAWKDPTDLQREAKTLITTVRGATLRVAFPELKQYTDMILDGTDSPMQGTSNGVRATLSATQVGIRELLVAKKLNGVLVSQSSLTMSADGTTLIEETWKTELPKMRRRMVYVRQ